MPRHDNDPLAQIAGKQKAEEYNQKQSAKSPIKLIQEEIFQIAKSNGFHEHEPKDPWKPYNEFGTDVVPRWLMLMVTELAEAMEAYRHRDLDNFKEELADVFIRLLDTCETMGIDLGKHVGDKMEKNRQREYRHGGKSC